MATETRTVKVEQEVKVCDRCKSSKGVDGLYQFGPISGKGSPHWQGDLCDRCHALILNRIKEPVKRTRKAVANAEK